MIRSAARAMATYQEVQVTSRSPLELVVMLYDGAIANLRQAHDGMTRGHLVAKRNGMKKALEIVQHLQSSLDMEAGGEVAAQLDALYRDVVTRVLEANVQTTPALLEEAIQLLTTVREAWHAIAVAPAPTMPVESPDRVLAAP
jgi:flagellar protein FliS